MDTLNTLSKCHKTGGVTHDYTAFEGTVTESCNTIKPAQFNR